MDSLPSSSSGGQQSCRRFEFHEIRIATQNFDESLVIGRGGFGKVYKGTLFNGVAAIKRLYSMSNQGADEFWAEIEMLSKLRHCYLVSLIGYCNYGKEMILVYEYMPNGNLYDHLHKLNTPLSWLQRLKICVGAARGLDYLHTGTGIDHEIIHRDVKSSNILLHESWAAKISDFGLSKISPKSQPSTYVKTPVQGTVGYLDPDYFHTGRLTSKSDIYAFGVVLFEVLCRRRAVDENLGEEQKSLQRWAQNSIRKGCLKRIIDSDMRDQISPKCLKEFARIAAICVHSDPKQRPKMAEVVVGLESVLTLQEKTNNPLELAGRSIFGRILDMLPLPCNRGHSAHGDSKLSSSSEGNTREVRADWTTPNPNLRVLKFADLKKATSNFRHRLVDGITGNMYLAWVDKKAFTASRPCVGMAVAVKMCFPRSSQGHAELLAELRLLGRLDHPNIRRLLGYCCHENMFLLVYEYFQNGSLGHLLRNASTFAEPLPWEKRLTIMMGVACGLSYLHSKVQVICGGVESYNIFLDQDFNAKIGDLRAARSDPEELRAARPDPEEIDNSFTTFVPPTLSYLDPAYSRTGYLSMESDIYCFGFVLLKALTGLRAFDLERYVRQKNLARWVKNQAGEGVLEKMIDPKLEKKYPAKVALECFALAFRCTAHRTKGRPSSEEVLRCLGAICAANMYQQDSDTPMLDNTVVHEIYNSITLR